MQALAQNVLGIQVPDSGHGITEERPDFVIRMLDKSLAVILQYDLICYISKENVEDSMALSPAHSCGWVHAQLGA